MSFPFLLVESSMHHPSLSLRARSLVQQGAHSKGSNHTLVNFASKQILPCPTAEISCEDVVFCFSTVLLPFQVKNVHFLSWGEYHENNFGTTCKIKIDFDWRFQTSHKCIVPIMESQTAQVSPVDAPRGNKQPPLFLAFV